MREIKVSKETYKKLIMIKNHWSFKYRKITNKKVLEILESLKKDIFGYDSTANLEKINEISMSKTRNQLEEESDRFQRELMKLLESGIDFEPEYTLDSHISKIIELIENNEEIGSPIF
jgi:hypothetical protein